MSFIQPLNPEQALTPEQAHTILFGGYVCGNPPNDIEIPMGDEITMDGGRKSTRIHTYNRNRSHRRRHRRHAQRGGAKLGEYASHWAACAEDVLMARDNPSGDDQTTTKTLRFYRLIIFIDIIHLLGKDNDALNLSECSNIVDIICAKLNNEQLLTAYFKSKFGSMQNVIWGAVGLSYEAHRQGIFSYFTQALSYISSSDAAATFHSYAVIIVNKTIEIWGLGWSLSGIVNWALLLYGIKQMLFSTKTSGEKQSVIARIFNFAIGSFITARDGFIAFPGMVGTVLTTANKYYSRGGILLGISGAASDAKHTACSAVVERLVKTQEFHSEMLLHLGNTFEDIIREIDPGRTKTLKCSFMAHIADPGLIAELNQLATLESQCAAMSAAAAAPVQQVDPVNPGGRFMHSERAKLLHNPIGGIAKPRQNKSSWGQTKGGSSKHKKKHPRPTNNRKLLVKRVKRRTTMKNKKR
jgi:hypothetical protein